MPSKKKKKVNTEHLFDPELIDAIRFSWNKQVYYYPVNCKFPMANIAIKVNGKERKGTGVYEQGDELYEKIRELYLKYYKENR